MHPELFQIPFTHLTVKSYGLMMVIGFLTAVYIIRRLSRAMTPDPQLITNAALYSLIAGVVGARLFYVIHYFEKFRGNLLSVFAIWNGGLELLGGVFLAITVIAWYTKYNKLSIRRYLDILAIGLMAALLFGRLGCFMNGCCFGKPTDLPWGVRFPYGSWSYQSQVMPNPLRNRPERQIKLPADYFGYVDKNGAFVDDLKPYDKLTPQQKSMVDTGPYRPLKIHPTEIYEALNGAIIGVIIYLFWIRSKNAEKSGTKKLFINPGSTFGLMFVFYGISRFLVEFLRDDNPFGFNGLTISQNIGIGMIILGASVIAVCSLMKPPPLKLINPE
jgi:phosphatidylglycerol---prolipoprotein diacylglyceryl transferase